MTGVRARAWALGRGAISLLLPPRCLSCGVEVTQTGALCAGCWADIEFLGPPCCSVCGYPFAHDMGPGAICAACAKSAPAYVRARAVFRYGDSSRSLVLGLKHADRTDAVPVFGQWLARAGAELLAEADVIAPVPLHRTRLLARRFNQSALLAHALGRESAVPVIAGLLRRTRRTPSQAGRSRAARRRNVIGAFALNPRYADAVMGRRVVLIDDVLTTGATVEAATRALLAGGASAVDVLVLARVVRPMA